MIIKQKECSHGRLAEVVMHNCKGTALIILFARKEEVPKYIPIGYSGLRIQI